MRRRRGKQGQELVKRGEILIDPEILQTQQYKEKKLGRPYKYPRALVLFFLFLKNTLGLSYRETEDLVKKLFNQLDASVQLPNFRTIHYRHTKESLQPKGSPQDLKEDFVAIVDSTGIKLKNRKEWLSEECDGEKRKSWIKLNLALDAGNYRLLDIHITSQKAHDEQIA